MSVSNNTQSHSETTEVKIRNFFIHDLVYGDGQLELSVERGISVKSLSGEVLERWLWHQIDRVEILDNERRKVLIRKLGTGAQYGLKKKVHFIQSRREFERFCDILNRIRFTTHTVSLLNRDYWFFNYKGITAEEKLALEAELEVPKCPPGFFIKTKNDQSMVLQIHPGGMRFMAGFRHDVIDADWTWKEIEKICLDHTSGFTVHKVWGEDRRDFKLVNQNIGYNRKRIFRTVENFVRAKEFDPIGRTLVSPFTNLRVLQVVKPHKYHMDFENLKRMQKEEKEKERRAQKYGKTKIIVLKPPKDWKDEEESEPLIEIDEEVEVAKEEKSAKVTTQQHKSSIKGWFDGFVKRNFD